MSNSTKSILVFLVVVLVVIGVWYFVAGNKQSAPTQSAAVAQSQTGAQNATTTSAGQAQNSPATSVANSGNSDTSFSQDLSAIDSQLKIVDGNSAAVDQGLNDKPVTQTE